MLAQARRLNSFIAEASRMPDYHSIGMKLGSYLDPMVTAAFAGSPEISLDTLLGWEPLTSDGRQVCFSQLGGVTISDARFLIEQLWLNRKSFLQAGRKASSCYPGWARLLLVLWQVILRHSPHGGGKSTEK